MLFSCDLVKNARKHKKFLEELHELGATLPVGSSSQFTQLRSLFRYQQLWLPLVKDHPLEPLIPPPDVAWLWHCHRLSPVNYVNYIMESFGKDVEIEATPPFCFQMPGCPRNESSIEMKTQNIWKTMYPDEPFFLPDPGANSGEGELSVKTPLTRDGCLLSGFDLQASAERQATFLWQISGERFEDDDFLEEGVENYFKFLKLKPRARESKVMLVPTYQIDLIWHTHILSSITDYNKDCRVIMGEVMNHDDSLTDRSIGGVLDVSYKSMVKLWKEEYNCEYAVCGGMYRGEPSASFFSKDWKAHDCLDAEAYQHLIRQMGASSTPSSPRPWVQPNSLTSDGSPAFIVAVLNPRSRSELKDCGYKKDYVLGKEASGVGWYHIETKEAIRILIKRCDRQIKKCECELAWSRACCWGGRRQNLDKLEARLEQYQSQRKALFERYCGSTAPSTTRDDQHVTARDGIWFVTPTTYSAAGGACGGTIACGPGACGGSACAGE
jgi:hypothetical protein